MKTRELMRCDIKRFGERVRTMKLKELRRHIERVAADLGEQDVDAMMEALFKAMFDDQDMPDTTSAEMDLVLAVLEKRIILTEENMDSAMRLMALLMAFMRQGVRKAAREQRLGEHPPDHDHCDDPDCEVHGHH